jgi:hypothetical protein
MTFWQCFISLMPFVLAAGLFFGVVYPAVMIVIYKLGGSRLSIREIMKRI